jgi:hypothetical protein
MAATYERIQTQTLSSTTTSLTFSGIPGSYTDLVYVINVGCNAAGNLQMQFNSDTGNNYSTNALYAYVPTYALAQYASMPYIYPGGVAGALPINTVSANTTSHIMNYSNTTTYKGVLSEYANPDLEVTTTAGTWRNTAAITSITISSYSAPYLVGSTFTLYGILKAA